MKWKNIAAGTKTFLITGTVTAWRPLFSQAQTRRILLEDLDFYRRKYASLVGAFVIMPEHYHVIAQFAQPQDLHGWLRDVHSHSANRLGQWLRSNASADELGLYRVHAGSRSRLAVWKEQSRAVGILGRHSLRVKIDYIHANPVRRGLVSSPGEWPWSSWRSYHLRDHSVFQVDRFELA